MVTAYRGPFAPGLTLGLFVALAPACSGGGTTVVSFCSDFASAYCDFGIRCGVASAAARTECIAYDGGSAKRPARSFSGNAARRRARSDEVCAVQHFRAAVASAPP